MIRVSTNDTISSYKTKDSSQIRELIHPTHNGNHNQSIAEARVTSGGKTIAHHHRVSEEIYLTTQGTGKLYIRKGQGEEVIVVDLQQGVNAVILPREIHWLENTGEGELIVLCCCSPPYSHEDTFLEP